LAQTDLLYLFLGGDSKEASLSQANADHPTNKKTGEKKKKQTAPAKGRVQKDKALELATKTK